MKRGELREMVIKLPYVDAKHIPDDALWAAVVCLGILVHAYRYEKKHVAHKGISVGELKFKTLEPPISDTAGDAPETKVFYLIRETHINRVFL